jgi:hypothetical protein
LDVRVIRVKEILKLVHKDLNEESSYDECDPNSDISFLHFAQDFFLHRVEGEEFGDKLLQNGRKVEENNGNCETDSQVNCIGDCNKNESSMLGQVRSVFHTNKDLGNYHEDGKERNREDQKPSEDYSVPLNDESLFLVLH